jgi:acyl carrier protein
MQQPAENLDDAADPADAALRGLLSDVLGLPESRVASFNGGTQLFGALPEMDSMAVANLLTEMEERLNFIIEDDEVEAEDFMTYGRLLHFVRRKLDSTAP